jgi:hypothetical protein
VIFVPEEVEKESIKDNPSAQIAVLAAKLTDFIEGNKESRVEILNAIDSLSKRVDSQNQSTCSRIKTLEDAKLTEDTAKTVRNTLEDAKTARIKLALSSLTIITVTIAIIQILHSFLGIF